jgi:hypothetical protein
MEVPQRNILPGYLQQENMSFIFFYNRRVEQILPVGAGWVWGKGVER